MKSGSLNFLEPSGPLQACNGTALPYLETLSYCSQKIIVPSYEHVTMCLHLRGLFPSNWFYLTNNKHCLQDMVSTVKFWYVSFHVVYKLSSSSSLLLSVALPVANAPDVLQPCGLLYYPWCSNSHHQSSPQEILPVRGGAKPYYF